ncbi:hypothetical protein F5Y04DRAFT_246477 [Hypomontagnella monticulosa]|nr:hypothetical protein F5Y04DRAFT_246477 [Hypomontagnella monticulosa]
MAASSWKSTLYPSEQFVEACGAIVFDTSTEPKQVMLLYHSGCDEWLLPKGRRNCNESRKDAAKREVREESGYDIELRPLTMATRAPSDWETADVKDVARTYDDLTEPFMLDVRDLGQSKGVKLVWWFIAKLGGIAGEGEQQFQPKFFQCDEAIQTLTFQQDRNVLIRALEVVESSADKYAPQAESDVELAHGLDTTLETTT